MKNETKRSNDNYDKRILVMDCNKSCNFKVMTRLDKHYFFLAALIGAGVFCNKVSDCLGIFLRNMS